MSLLTHVYTQFVNRYLQHQPSQCIQWSTFEILLDSCSVIIQVNHPCKRFESLLFIGLVVRSQVWVPRVLGFRGEKCIVLSTGLFELITLSSRRLSFIKVTELFPVTRHWYGKSPCHLIHKPATI